MLRWISVGESMQSEKDPPLGGNASFPYRQNADGHRCAKVNNILQNATPISTNWPIEEKESL